MRVMAQMGMVMNLDKCIGCHTCSVTCKQAWTNRAGHRVRLVQQRRDPTRAGLPAPPRGPGAVEGRLGARQARPPAAQDRRTPQAPAVDLRQPGPARARRLLRAVDLRLQDPRRGAPGRRLPGGPPEVAHHRRGHEGHVVGQLGRQPRRAPPRWGTSTRSSQTDPARVRGQDQVRVRADLHVLPAPDLRALPQPVLHGVLPVGRDLQALRGRHRAGRPGPLPRLAPVHHRLPVQEDLLQPQVRQGREVHVLLPPRRGRHPDRVLGDVRGPAALPRAVPVRRRRGHGGGVGARRPGPLRGPDGPHPRPGGPRRHRGRAGAGHPGGLAGRRPPIPGLRAGEEVPRRAAAAPGVPHDADGLVRPAAVAGRRPAHRAGPRRRGQRRPLRCHRGAADPGRVPRRALHRRGHRGHRRRAAQARRHARLHARPQPRPRARRLASPPRSG